MYQALTELRSLPNGSWIERPSHSHHPGGCCEHVVQFYEDDAFLTASVADFFEAGLAADEGAVLVATKPHRAAIEARLEAAGYDLAAHRARGSYIELDADATLALFMRGGAPDRKRFFRAIGPVLDRAAAGTRQIRVFGEMVALLVASGNPAGAERLEELWNEFGEFKKFTLMCAYPIRDFSGPGDGAVFERICKTHDRVIPSESFTARTSPEDQMAALAKLQQKAVQLEAELAARKQMERSLREQRTELEMATAIADLGIWELDLKSGVFVASDVCKGHFGVDPKRAFTFALLEELLHPEDRAEVERAIRSASAAGREFNTEFRIVDSGGRLRWISARGRVLRKRGRRMFGVTMDITDRKRASEELERAVADRTGQLRESMAELEAYSRSISHDLRSPLRVMQNYAEIIIQEYGETVGPECRGFLRRITSAASRMGQLIENVLSFSRLSRAEIELRPVDLEWLTRGILETYGGLYPPGVKIEIEGRLPVVTGDPTALTQCLTNLLGNAVKFVAPGVSPHIRIWAEPLPDNGLSNMTRLCIQDNGIGIPEHAQKMIFEIFQRVDCAYEGTGIGLAIVKKAVDRMGGRVGVTSAPEKGSCFWIDLKRAEWPLAK